MKQSLIAVLVGVLLLTPSLVSAHETQHFVIGGKEYMFVVGSLNEPIVVDDKTGVDLTISKVGHHEASAHSHEGGEAISGLEETLKVELIAGDQKKVLDLSPVYGKAGSYKAVFYPTVATTYTYRVFGEIDGTAVDLPFTCSVKGHAEAKEDTAEVAVSEGVTRTLKTGSFGCPVEKEAFGFPEKSADVRSLDQGVSQATTIAGIALALALALLLAGYVATRRR